MSEGADDRPMLYSDLARILNLEGKRDSEPESKSESAEEFLSRVLHRPTCEGVKEEQEDGLASSTGDAELGKSQRAERSELSKRGRKVKKQISTNDGLFDARIELHELLVELNRQSDRPQDTAGLVSELDEISRVLSSHAECFSLYAAPTTAGQKNDESRFDEHFSSLKRVRPDILEYWHEKSKIARSLTKLEPPINDQIENAMQDKDKLIERTRIPRFKQRQSSDCGEKSLDKDRRACFDDSDFVDNLVSCHFGSTSLMRTMPNTALQNYLKHKESAVKGNERLKTAKGKNVTYKTHSKIVSFAQRVNTARESSVKVGGATIERQAFVNSLFSS